MRNAEYEVLEINKIKNYILIRDMDLPGRLSVTNDAENVVKRLYDCALIDSSVRLFYVDTQNHIDQILHENGIFTGFKILP